MKILIAGLLSFIFLILAIIHLYWGFGGKTLKTATIPTKLNNKPVIKPGAIDCFVVAAGLPCFGIIALIKVNIISFNQPQWLSDWGLRVIAFLFILRAIGEFKYIGFFKKIKNTEFGRMDTKYYSPLCLLVGFLAIILECIN